MQDEIRNSTMQETGEPQNDCDLDTFVRLFVNHRPVWGIGKENIKEAFDIISENKGSLTYGIDLFSLKTNY